MDISLRKSITSDLELFFLHQSDEAAIHMAAFTAKDPHDKDAFMEKWKGLMADPRIHMQTILLDQKVVGCVVKYVMEGAAEITYAMDKAYWGNGYTSLAVRQFLELEPARPMHARVAHDNLGSQKILERTGFKRIGTARGFANARGMEIEEFLYRLDR